MFVMRYKEEFCGGISVEAFLRACGAEGAPIYRGYAMTMSEQPALQKLMVNRPDYFRRMPTPVSDQATKELIYISQEIFLGSETDMTEIAAAIKKVETNYSGTGGASVL
jgi:hypothetical protein